MLKFIKFQANANQISPRQASARTKSCSLLQIQRFGLRRLPIAFHHTRMVPMVQSTPKIPNMIIHGGRPLMPLGSSLSEIVADQPTKNTSKRIQTARTSSRNLPSDGLYSSFFP